MGDNLNKRRIKGTNTNIKKTSLIDSKNLERNLMEEISKEFISKDKKKNK